MSWRLNYKETHLSVKKLMKTKGNGRNLYKMLNARLRNCRSILAFRVNKVYKEKDLNENVWRAVDQFLSTIMYHAILWKVVYFSLLFSLKKFIMQITWNVTFYYWHAPPAIDYGKLPVSIFFKIFPVRATFSFFLLFTFDYSLRKNNKNVTAHIS